MKSVEQRKHHYVPQLLLRNFAAERGETLFAFDKASSRTFQVAVKDAAAEKGFNTSTWNRESVCVEELYSEIEDLAAPILRNIVENGRLCKFSPRDRVLLLRFATAQVIRTKAHRAVNAQLGTFMRMIAAKEGSQEFKEWVGEFRPEKEKFEHLKSTKRMVHEFSGALLDKDILLFETSKEIPLVISDNPVALTNTLNRSEFRSTTGLASKQVEVYLPISPRFALGFMCKEIGEEFRRACLFFGRKTPTVILDYLLGIASRKNQLLAPANSIFLNSIQIRNAERYVYSATADFALAEEMMINNPELKVGPRPTILDRGSEVDREDIEGWAAGEGKRNRG